MKDKLKKVGTAIANFVKAIGGTAELHLEKPVLLQAEVF